MATRRTFEHTATTGFVVLAVLLALGMAFSIRRFELEANAQVARLRAEENEITLVERLRWSGELIVSDGRGYLISGDPSLLSRVQDSRNRFLQITDELRAQPLSGSGRELTGDAERAAREFIRVQGELLEARQRSVSSQVLIRRFEAELLPLRQQLDAALTRLVEYKEAMIVKSYESARRDRSRLAVRLYGLVGVLLLAGLVISRYFATQLSRAFRHEQEALETARKALAARDELMGIVAHDLRNPLGAIMMKAALMRKGAHPDRIRQQAESIENVATRMEHLIKTMLDVTTVEAGKFSVTPERCNVEDLLRQAAEIVETVAASKQVELEYNLNERGLAVRADRERVLQVLTNLVGNALKFTPQGGRVTIAVERQGAMVQFGVLDTGPGISRENIPRIFDRFWQERTSGNKGTGLGLFIAKGIIDAHGGRIWAESEVGRGTQIYFTIPCAEPEATQVRAEHEEVPLHPM